MHDLDGPSLIETCTNAMKEIYVDTKEELPTNVPPPFSDLVLVQVNCFVDRDCAGDQLICLSQTEIIL